MPSHGCRHSAHFFAGAFGRAPTFALHAHLVTAHLPQLQYPERLVLHGPQEFEVVFTCRVVLLVAAVLFCTRFRAKTSIVLQPLVFAAKEQVLVVNNTRSELLMEMNFGESGWKNNRNFTRVGT